MGDLLRKVYNYYAPAAIVIWFTFSGHWVWLLGVIGFLLVTISYNIEVHLRVTAMGVDEILKRLGSADPKGD
jgi:zinc transporter ZupT